MTAPPGLWTAVTFVRLQTDAHLAPLTLSMWT